MQRCLLLNGGSKHVECAIPLRIIELEEIDVPLYSHMFSLAMSWVAGANVPAFAMAMLP